MEGTRSLWMSSQLRRSESGKLTSGNSFLLLVRNESAALSILDEMNEQDRNDIITKPNLILMLQEMFVCVGGYDIY